MALSYFYRHPIYDNFCPEPSLRTDLNDFHQYVITTTHTHGDTLDLIIGLLQNIDTVTKQVPYTDNRLIAVKLDYLQSGY